ncbi:MAG: NADH:flavin oxidoreductase [Bacteroidales bacterium]|uniref:NADH:flavin oxidoreductase n=1 Tax=Candidatus Cryptobacteroides sp. TaxID=2952915 RepID=UPI002A83E96E|nr:NADH:flavin oxidoreductase [Candidatus Cryptobacteroides sp.]MBS7277547.1 NADH:flavin oxidoreductase [Bacteroidales bacterium]MCI6527213.1 NADH:flavin oxidoreductase [Bacteroidales bacterium]MDD5914994.1 NADH:flavin oxidoreductase [Bacteroidales bacterium]MDY5043644.1 NADH:flavin oxidoreductase [Candidatus Cryptobacteroides sp.]
MSIESPIFTPVTIGPVTLRNRVIRSAAFENMAYGNSPSQDLYDYHVAVARGGVGMTTLAYAAVDRSGLSFDGQLWMRKEIVPDLRRITDAIHAEGAKASIQLGHCGNMTHRSTCGCMPVGASGGFNMYSPTFVRSLKINEIHDLVKAFGNAVNLAREAGFDCVEIHAGHGYLISQFLSPYTNHRHDEFGGSLENRMRFMRMVISEVMKAAGDDLGVIVKMNMHDGFKKGMQRAECLEVAKELERLGVHAIVLSAGFVSKAPMEVMRGAMPLKTLAHYMDMKKFWWLKAALLTIGRLLIPTVPYREGYFLEDAMQFRQVLKLPLIYVGGLISKDKMEEVLAAGFQGLQVARALVHDTDFVNKLHSGEITCSGCKHSNYCIGRMYTLEMRCHHCVENMPASLRKEIEKAEAES